MGSAAYYYEPECPCPPPGWSKEPAATTPTATTPTPGGAGGGGDPTPTDCDDCLARLCVVRDGGGVVVDVVYAVPGGVPVTVGECGNVASCCCAGVDVPQSLCVLIDDVDGRFPALAGVTVPITFRTTAFAIPAIGEFGYGTLGCPDQWYGSYTAPDGTFVDVFLRCCPPPGTDLTMFPCRGFCPFVRVQGGSACTQYRWGNSTLGWFPATADTSCGPSFCGAITAYPDEFSCAPFVLDVTYAAEYKRFFLCPDAGLRIRIAECP